MSEAVVIALIGLAGVVITVFYKRADHKLDEIHVLVNRQLSEAMEKIEALREALRYEVERTNTRAEEEPDVGDHLPGS